MRATGSPEAITTLAALFTRMSILVAIVFHDTACRLAARR
jgi:hypothetical protein